MLPGWVRGSESVRIVLETWLLTLGLSLNPKRRSSCMMQCLAHTGTVGGS